MVVVHVCDGVCESLVSIISIALLMIALSNNVRVVMWLIVCARDGLYVFMCVSG